MEPKGDEGLKRAEISVLICALFFIILIPGVNSDGYSKEPADQTSIEDVTSLDYDDFTVASGDGHMHTNHSSGTTTVAENVAMAKNRGLEWIVITDHKTVSTAPECAAESIGNFLCIVGEEVSTVEGHVLGWGLDDLVDWSLTPTYTMSDIFEGIHAKGGLAVVTHPFAPDPDDYDHFGVHDGFDSIEVYHGYAGFNDFPLSTDMDGQALAKWEDFLNIGWRKTAVGDSDCHNASNTPDGGDLTNRRGAIGYPRNVLYLQEFSQRGILEAVRNGRLYVTDGPILNFTVSERIMGETIYEPGPSTLTINISGSATASSELHVIRNGTQIFSQPLSPGPFSHSIFDSPPGDSWYRTEIRNPTLINGEIDVAFSNPIYYDQFPFEEPPLPPTNLSAKLNGSDVVLEWDPSLSADIDLYSIFRSDSISNFNFSYPFAYTTKTSWTDENSGMGDNKTYFYIVRSIDRTKLNDSNTNRVAKLFIPLERGVHLVSIPIAPSNDTLGSVFQTLDYDAIWMFDKTDPQNPWRSRMPSKT
jgi:predicted metal-dependent phosphoesterase TrpH